MKGAIFLGDRKVELRDFPLREPAAGEVVVAVRASGMCGSDLHVYRAEANYPTTADMRIAGHEPAGVVHSVGPGVSNDVAAVGDRVMIHHYIGCTTCDRCRSGWPQMCTRAPFRAFGTQEHGGHAPYIVVPAATLVPLDDALSFEAGATIGCGTGTAWGALERLGDVGGSTIAVVGQGPVGLSATMLATARGARVIAVDPEPNRRAQAERFGAMATVDPTIGSASEAVRELTEGEGVPLVLETSGASAAISAGMDSLAPWGKICLVGLGGGEARFRVTDFYRSQVTVMTSWTMSIVQQRQCAEFIVRHNIPIDELFSHRWTLSQAVEAYDEFDKQNAGKGVFVFDEA
ncbi:MULTISPECIES: zinc-dependent alcohol dehydrogenase family protein [unclassified Rhodococcus (in: high G+C Gram-positive bacteria)]|uniref:zinc-dependent alcohol dehydrogenase family protein n=1 Tax=unclassified Rhodococcus (in: high G+C Gram-positive bacteria) TaxID=192944 RepID=UPI000700AAF0|nr:MULTISPECIES: zinc-binding dehydrogenase [unclassified Rhodococcus (in: high G+C Gram-positive bacteria)]KQU28458.1 iditol 2-dehydrogenase [Rhodococcus sp. Leaf225]KQU47662.1 iditol 2-dehydrogenase [Rhodococcus sp. Leaf258]